MPFNLFSIAEIVTRPAFCEFERIPLIVADGKWFMDEVTIPVLAAHQHRALWRGADMTNGRRYVADPVSDPTVF